MTNISYLARALFAFQSFLCNPATDENVQTFNLALQELDSAYNFSEADKQALDCVFRAQLKDADKVGFFSAIPDTPDGEDIPYAYDFQGLWILSSGVCTGLVPLQSSESQG